MHFTDIKSQDITSTLIVGEGFGPLPLPVVLYADGTALSLTPQNGCLCFDDLQREVGGYVEIHPLPAMPEILMAMDEEARFEGKPRNKFASEIMGTEILGDVVLMLKEEEGK